MGEGVSVVLSHKVMVIYYCSPRKPVQHGMGVVTPGHDETDGGLHMEGILSGKSFAIWRN